MDLREDVLVVLLFCVNPVDAAVAGVLFLSEKGDEALEVGARHQQVYVVVPRDEALVPGSPDKGTVGHRVAYCVFDAESIYCLQNVKKVRMDFT